MPEIPDQIRDFLSGSRFAVAGVSRSRQQPANTILRKLRDAGFEAIPINPNADQLEGTACYPDLSSIPGTLDGVVIATHPTVSASVVAQAAEANVDRVWFHRSFGDGSVSDEAVQLCRDLGVEAIVGGCPLMFCEPIDFAHRCMRWWLQRQGTVPR
jgi:predicted CoA-binding protein